MPDLEGFLTADELGQDKAVNLGPARAKTRRPWPALASDDGPVDVSVCIANWNCRDLLRACLTSLLDPRQGVRLEVIVVDNGSTDGAAAMVARDFPEVILHENPANFGFARANNQAADRARGRYVFFLNNDTVVPAGAIRRLLHYAESNPGVGMIGPRLFDAQGRTQLSYRQRPTMATLLHRTTLLRWTGLFRDGYHRYRRQDFDPHNTRPVEVLMGAALFLRRDVFYACGCWDERYQFGGEDLDLSFQVGRRFPVMYLPQVEITHYGRVSTRQHIGYASAQMTAGFARYLRRTGCSPSALAVYKTIIILDAPVQMTAKWLQYWWRRRHGRSADAEKSLLAMQGLWHFLRHGLGAFLRA
jgi:GT2 family glycosyltransferase